MKVSGYLVEGLYIKLDKRLTLKADKIIIPQRKENPSIHSIDEALARVKSLLTFFHHIDLKEIHFKNNVLGIYFLDNILQLSSKDYLIRGNVYREGKILRGTIPIFQFKKHNLLMRGEFSYDLDKDMLKAEGKFVFEETQGYFKVSKRQDEVEFALSSDRFSDLKPIIDKFDMPATVKSWIVDKVQAKSYQVLSLRGKGNIGNKKFSLHLDTLKAEVLFSDVSIYFKEGVAPVLARSFILDYSDDKGLRFNLEQARYLDKNLDGSVVSIVNLRDDNTTLKLNLKFDTRFDKDVQTLLQAYNISLPVLQKNGKVIASLDADIGLKKSAMHFVVDVKFLKGNVQIHKLNFPIEKGDLRYEKGSVFLKNISLSHPMYEGVLNGKLDLSKKKADFVFDAKKVTLKTEAKTLVTLKNEKIPFTLEYKQGVFVNIPKYTLTLQNKQKITTLTVKNLRKIKSYISKTIPIEDGGNVQISTKDFETFIVKGIMKRSSCFIYTDSSSCATRVPIYAKVSKDDIDFYAFDKSLHYNKKRNRVTLKNINIDLEKFLATEVKKTTKKSKKKNLVIIGKNSNLRYGKYSLVTDSYDVEVKHNGDIKAIGSSDGDIIKFTKIKDILGLQALRIKDKTLHPLINFKGLQQGRYSLAKTGNPKKEMKGEIIVEGGVMSGFKAYNNTLAFINTIPALVTLQNPGYSDKGFTINSGVVSYRMINSSKILFDSIYIKGESATIIGKGELDLDKKTINIELGIQVARTLGKVLGSIPLVGYILVGKEKSLTVGLQITGSLDKPEVNVSAAKDILSYPLQLIKRTFEAPQHLLSSEENNTTK